MSISINYVLAALVACTVLPATAAAQRRESDTAIVVIDLTGETPRAVGYCNVITRVCDVKRRHVGLVDSLRHLVKNSPMSTRLRASVTRTSHVHAIVLYNRDDSASLTLRETPRVSRIVSDVRTVLSSLGRVVGTADVSETVHVVEKTLTLQEVRGTVSITAQVVKQKTDTVSLTYVVTTGPGEHLFMTGNVDASAVRQGSLDSTNAISPKKPTAFFLALNYAIADLYLPDPDQSRAGLWKSLYVGAMIQADRRPFDQVGVTMGLRHNPVPCLKDWLDFRTVAPYIGYLWERDRVHKRYQQQGWIWGVSVELSKATTWLSDAKP